MPVTLFIKERSGNFNFEDDRFLNKAAATRYLQLIMSDGGYAVIDENKKQITTTFIPWHQVDFARIEQTEEANGNSKKDE